MNISNYVVVTADVEGLVEPDKTSPGLFINHIFYWRCCKLTPDKRCEFSLNQEMLLDYDT